MSNFRWIAAYVKPYWVFVLLNILCNMLTVVFSLFSLSMVVPFLNLLFGLQKLETSMPDNLFSSKGMIQGVNYYISKVIIDQGKINALLFICFLIVVLFLLKNLFRYLALFNMAPILAGVVKDIRHDVHQKVLHLPLAFFTKERRGDIISRVTSDVQEIEWAIIMSIEAVFREPFAILFYMGVLFATSVKLTLFIMVLLPVTGIVIGRIGKSLRKQSATGQQKMGLLLSIIEETIGGLRIIKAFTAEKFIQQKFKKTNDEFGDITVKMYNRKNLASPLSEFLGAVVMSLVMWFGGKLVLSGSNQMQPADFIFYIVLFSQIIAPAKALTSAYYSVQKGMASAERVRMVMDAPLQIVDIQDAVEKKDFGREIRYKNVSFAYNRYNNEKVLKNISLTIPKGQTIALVGQSGSGKSTMADLLPRFYDFQEGDIQIDGLSIKKIRLNSLRKLIGIVTQESILFNDTVFNNIAFGMPDATEDQVMEAARIANAHDFIMEFPDGYYYNIGDRGGRLSGGQKQRLSIARAVLKNPPILILDEATSSLDTESERLVQDALTKLMQSRTTIVIAHRLSTIQHADQILVLQRGDIIENGTHTELLAKNGVYKKLYDLQSFI